MPTFSPFSRARVDGTPASPKTPTPRELLRQAQAAAAATSQAAQDAAQASARGQIAVDRARAAFATHEGVDGRVAAYNADLLRVGESAGRAALPADLIEARRAKGTAAEGLADAAAAHGVVAGEAREAAAAAEQADGELRAAADAVAQEVVAGLVAELRERELEAGRLRIAITGFIGGRTSVDPPVPWSITSLMHEPQHPHLVDLVGASWPAASAAWNDYRKRLMTDADATLEAVP